MTDDVKTHGVLAGQTWYTAGGGLVYVSQVGPIAAQVVRAWDRFAYTVERNCGRYIAPVDAHYKRRYKTMPLKSYVRGPSLQDHTAAPTAEEDEAWKEREARMDVVGQNGNDGEHYPTQTMSEADREGFSRLASGMLNDLKEGLREYEEAYEVKLGTRNTAAKEEALRDQSLRFLDDVRAEVVRARSKFAGGDNLTGLALAEEFGEVIKAALDESRSNVWKEAVQTAAMACRLATEGDPTVGEWRRKKGLDALDGGKS